MSGWSSGERLRCALSNQEPDRVPVWCLWRGSWSGDTADTARIPIADQCRRVETVLGLGLDDTLLLKPPGPREDQVMRPEWIPPVEVRANMVEQADGTRRLVKEFSTPDGVIRHAARVADPWPYDNDMAFFSDLNITQGAEYLIKSPDDLPAVRHLLRPPTADQVREFRERAKVLKACRDKLGVLIEGGWSTTVDAAVWLCGLDNLVLFAADTPEFVEELLGMLYEWERPRTELMLEEGVDLLVHSAWYEMPHFWSPRLYRQLIKPLLKREVELAHSGGAHFVYILTAGSSMVLDDLLEIGVDSLRGLDPVQGYHDDLLTMKQGSAGRMALWGGLNAATVLERGTPQEVRAAVEEAIRICGPGGGFVLHPVDQVWTNTPWENVEAMIDAWRAVGTYPLAG